jgi:proteasome lid subunit RPN8/RPN11
MLPLSLYLSTTEYHVMRQHAEQAYPHECCGVFTGKVIADERHVQKVVPCRNVRIDSPHNRFEIDAAELVRVQREARENGMEIVGFYHSHPDHPAQPSPTDLEEAHWVGCSYVITSVEQGKAGETRSFMLAGTQEKDKAFSSEPVVVG